ncbi:hypothetical protein K402DRAFT_333112, partial [Aulographum hederae CBS 113979]
MTPSSSPLPPSPEPEDVVQRIHAPDPQLVNTTLFISNLHCPSCVNYVQAALLSLNPQPASVSTSIVAHSVCVTHPSYLAVSSLSEALESVGFDVHSIFQERSGEPPVDLSPPRPTSEKWEDSLESAVARW